MPSEGSLQALLDIRDNIHFARQFMGDLDEAAFIADRKTVYSVIRCLEIISEASRRLAPDLKARHPEQPWDQIAGAGNIYRHNYENVAAGFVWRTVTVSLLSLLQAVEAELTGP
jgi:uncharacterized protein with HEPN domain